MPHPHRPHHAITRSLALLVLTVTVLTPAAFAEPPWRFVIVGDSRGDTNGVNVPILSEIADAIVASGAEFVLFPGDLVNGGLDQTGMQSQLTTWRTTMQAVYDAGIAVYPVRGNHDLGSPASATPWNAVFTGPYALPANGPPGEINLTYSVTHKNVFVLALDQYITDARVNQTWIDTQLAANTQPHIVALGHEPAFQVQHTDCLDDYPANRDAFWASLKNAGCTIYTCGHDHFYDHAVIDDGDGNPANDIHQYLVGTAGAPLRSWSPPYTGDNSGMTITQWHHCERYGYVLVDVTDGAMTMTWYERDDTGHYAPPTGPRDLNADGLVDFKDFTTLADQWLRTDCRPDNFFCSGADIDQHNDVTSDDLALFSQDWLSHTPQDYRVTSSADDAEENNSTHAVNLTSTDLELVIDTTAQTIGIRFEGIAIPRGTTITGAYLQFTVDETATISPCNLTITAQAADNPPAFTTAAADISSRPTTAASVTWNDIPAWTTVGETGPDQRSPNLAAVLQEVIDRPGFTAGNAVVFIITGTGKRVAESCDGSPSTAAALHITLQ